MVDEGILLSWERERETASSNIFFGGSMVSKAEGEFNGLGQILCAGPIGSVETNGSLKLQRFGKQIFITSCKTRRNPNSNPHPYPSDKKRKPSPPFPPQARYLFWPKRQRFQFQVMSASTPWRVLANPARVCQR